MRNEKSGKVNRPVLWLLISLLLGLAAVAGLAYWGYSRPGPAAEKASAGAVASAVSLHAPSSDYVLLESGAATVEAEEETAPDFDYDCTEVLVDEDGIRILRIRGKRYRGVLAEIDDPKRLFVGSIPYYSETGSGMTLDKLMERSGAVLGLNGGGFQDITGMGAGGMPQGVVICDGTMWLGYAGGQYDVCAFTDEGRLITGVRTGQELVDANVQWAVSFGPALIVDNMIQEFNNTYWEPRSAVGQREDGTVLLLALEGRQVAAQGACLALEAEIMAKHGAVNATNLDGGASTVMLYKGEMMHRANYIAGMRPMPTAVLVKPLEEGAGE